MILIRRATRLLLHVNIQIELGARLVHRDHRISGRGCFLLSRAFWVKTISAFLQRAHFRFDVWDVRIAIFGLALPTSV